MKYDVKPFLSGLILIFLSAPLGRMSINYYGRLVGNLGGDEYSNLLHGFIRSYWTLGIILVVISFMLPRKQ